MSKLNDKGGKKVKQIIGFMSGVAVGMLLLIIWARNKREQTIDIW